MPSSSSTSINSPAGIITSPSGARRIPSSTRADGSKRKEIKIRPGYQPPEEVEVYKNRTAEAWKTRGRGAGVPGAAGLESDAGAESKAANSKNAKRREARKKAKESGEANGDGASNENNEDAKTNGTEATTPVSQSASGKENWRPEPKNPDLVSASDSDKEKQARNLKKKLRQARELREKKAKGENLLPEQFEKVIKINELIRQLDALGFHANGEPKEPSADVSI